jgi:tellurite resistance protein TerB
MFGKMFGKKKAQVTAEVRKFENRDLMEAVVGGCLLVAYADGTVEDSELANLEAQIQANPSMEHFGAEIGKTINRFMGMFDAGFRLGKMKVLREIADIKTNPEEAEEVFVSMITIAEADGEIDAKEIEVLKEVGKALGLSLKDFGIE